MRSISSSAVCSIPLTRNEAGRKMGAVAPTLFGAIKLLVNNRTAISEVAKKARLASVVKTE
jgi:hypothetical protein